jgi:hypothetical protein
MAVDREGNADKAFLLAQASGACQKRQKARQRLSEGPQLAHLLRQLLWTP